MSFAFHFKCGEMAPITSCSSELHRIIGPDPVTVLPPIPQPPAYWSKASLFQCNVTVMSIKVTVNKCSTVKLPLLALSGI